MNLPMKKHSTFNIQHPTSKDDCARHSFGVECSVLNVECFFSGPEEML